MSWRARVVAADMAWSELEIEFWERHADRLTPDERTRTARGEITSLRRPVAPEWAVGEWLPAAANLWIKPAEAMFRPGRQVIPSPDGTTRTRGLWIIPFDIRDHRPRLIRRNPHAMDFAAIRGGLDVYGMPRRVSEQDAATAAEASHYTASAALAVSDAGEAIDRQSQEIYAAEAAAKRALADDIQVQAELDRINRLPVRMRAAELVTLAESRGLDLRGDIKAFERRIARRLNAAA